VSFGGPAMHFGAATVSSGAPTMPVENAATSCRGAGMSYGAAMLPSRRAAVSSEGAYDMPFAMTLGASSCLPETATWVALPIEFFPPVHGVIRAKPCIGRPFLIPVRSSCHSGTLFMSQPLLARHRPVTRPFLWEHKASG
jgi:hypothetical protein